MDTHKIQLTKKDHHGQAMVEVAIIISLVAVVTILSLSVVGVGVRNLLCQAAQGLGAAGVCGALFEDFSDISDWDQTTGKNCSNETGQLCCDKYNEIFKNDFEGEDYTVSVDVANLGQGDGYGMFFRAQNYENPQGYIFQYDPGYGAFIFRKWVDGHELSPFAVKKVPGFDWYGKDHTVQLVVHGDTFTAFVDGKEVLTGSDSTYSEGGIGLRTWDSTKACIDDLSITTP